MFEMHYEIYFCKHHERYEPYESSSVYEGLTKLDDYKEKLKSTVISVDEMYMMENDLKLLKSNLQTKIKNSSTNLANDGYFGSSYKKYTAIKDIIVNIQAMLTTIANIKATTGIDNEKKNNLITFKDVPKTKHEQARCIMPSDLLKSIFNMLPPNNIVPLRRLSKFWRNHVDNNKISQTYMLLPYKYSSKRLILNFTNFSRSLTYSEYVSLLRISKCSYYDYGTLDGNLLIASLQRNITILQNQINLSSKKLDSNAKESVLRKQFKI